MLLALLLGLVPPGQVQARPGCGGAVAATSEHCALPIAPQPRAAPPAPCVADALAILTEALPAPRRLILAEPQLAAPALLPTAKALVAAPWKPPRRHS